MRRLLVLLCALLFVPGCLTAEDRAMWREAVDDANGENMKMKYDTSPIRGM